MQRFQQVGELRVQNWSQQKCYQLQSCLTKKKRAQCKSCRPSCSTSINAEQYLIDFDGYFDESLVECNQSIGQNVLNALENKGIHLLTTVQEKALQPILNGKDVIVRSETGSGKTLAYGIPLAHKILNARKLDYQEYRKPEAIILASTRDLCEQIGQELASVGLETAILVGGLSREREAEQLITPVHVVVATPKYLLKVHTSKQIQFDNVTALVVDEYDDIIQTNEMAALSQLLFTLPKARQTMLFSATLPFEVRQSAQEATRNPVIIDLLPQNIVGKLPDSVTATTLICSEAEKQAVTLQLLNQHVGPYNKALVFVNNIASFQDLVLCLNKHHVPFACVTGRLDSTDRCDALTAFRNGDVSVLVATDLVARGMDFDDVGVVISHDLAYESSQYINRAGRTGRAGRQGVSISLADPTQIPQIEHLLSKTGNAFDISSAPPPAAAQRSMMSTMVGYVTYTAQHTLTRTWLSADLHAQRPGATGKALARWRHNRDTRLRETVARHFGPKMAPGVLRPRVHVTHLDGVKQDVLYFDAPVALAARLDAGALAPASPHVKVSRATAVPGAMFAGLVAENLNVGYRPPYRESDEWDAAMQFEHYTKSDPNTNVDEVLESKLAESLCMTSQQKMELKLIRKEKVKREFREMRTAKVDVEWKEHQKEMDKDKAKKRLKRKVKKIRGLRGLMLR